jgi:hypothetical protein
MTTAPRGNETALIFFSRADCPEPDQRRDCGAEGHLSDECQEPDVVKVCGVIWTVYLVAYFEWPFAFLLFNASRVF